MTTVQKHSITVSLAMVVGIFLAVLSWLFLSNFLSFTHSFPLVMVCHAILTISVPYVAFVLLSRTILSGKVATASCLKRGMLAGGILVIVYFAFAAIV
jgi:hypothetical protein